MLRTNNTKKALLSSAFALVLSVAMLIGTTFAWFTDTASTGVNKIVSGNLKVDIICEDSDKHIDTLNFTKAGAETDAGAAEEILWEPGCRYLTEGFRIANKGNLALKWKAQVNMDNIVNGKVVDTAKDGKSLLDVIDFYLVTSKDADDMGTALDEFSGNLTAKTNSDVYYIKGVMQTTAGNDYQNLTLEGITITVVATQDTVENDSFGNTYDENAKYPVTDSDELSDAIREAADGSTVVIASGEYALPGTSVSNGLAISGAGADETVLKTDSQNYEFTGENVTIKDVTIDGTKVSKVDNNGAIKITGSNAVLDNVKLIGGGQNTYGHTLRVDMKAGSVTTIRNSTISGAFRGIQSFALNGTLLIENSTLAPQCYCLNVDAGTGKLVVKNSKLMGWTSYTSSVESATFTDCVFEVNPDSYGYNYLCPYTDTALKNCTLGKGFMMGAGGTGFKISFDNCNYNGAALTATNVHDLFDSDDLNNLKGCIITVDGVNVVL